MKKCLIVINLMSGRACRIDRDALVAKFRGSYEVTVKEISSPRDVWSAEGYDLIVACGGDGTFNRAVNNDLPSGAKLIYYSYGTFNECAKAKGKSRDQTEFIRLYEYATVNDTFFGYVTAAGSFTPLGYIVDSKAKQRMGILAYISKVLSQYKVCDIPAKITADGERYDGRYTVIMAIDSMRCFGFRFNKMYRPDDGEVHMLLIKSPGKNGLLNKLRIFFPLFRSFFIGFRREHIGRSVIFRAAKHISIELERAEVFDVDGDAKVFGTLLDVRVQLPKNELYIADIDRLNLF